MIYIIFLDINLLLSMQPPEPVLKVYVCLSIELEKLTIVLATIRKLPQILLFTFLER